ncbi:MAG: lytic transglycosylase domain-containing protein [Myxococcales bacterium]|nr:lytic transglycosylase domain-containing protein [Myxococcales bacterium]
MSSSEFALGRFATGLTVAAVALILLGLAHSASAQTWAISPEGSLDEAMLRSTGSSPEPEFQIARLAREGQDQGLLLDLASLHRTDSLQFDARIRLARRLFETRPEVASQLLAFEPPADLQPEWALASVELALVSDELHVAHELLAGSAAHLAPSLAAGTADSDRRWCERAAEVISQSPIGPAAPLYAALCTDEIPAQGSTQPEDVAGAMLALGERRYRTGFGEASREVLRELVSWEEAPLDTRCAGAVLLGRSENRTGSDARANRHYEWVLSECGHLPDEIIKALYGLGKDCALAGDVGCAEQYLLRIQADFPESTYVDDALFYLADMYRRRGNRSAEMDIVERSLALPADGDMWRETVWRSARRLIRDHELEEAAALLERAANRFSWDGTYYSQGRFEYFLAWYSNLPDDAEAWARRVLNNYPLTFYARQICQVLGDRAVDWSECSDTPPSFADASELWPLASCLSPVGRWYDLVRLGDFSAAARSLESMGLTCDEGLWIEALLFDLAGEYSISHNIPRRRISGWASTVSADNYRQWRIAYPLPESYLAILDEVLSSDPAFSALDPALAFAIMREESGFVSGIQSYAGAQGLMQLMPRTAEGHAEGVEGEITIERLAQPEVNIRIGANFLAHLGRHFENDPIRMAAAYNAGRGRVNSWIGERPYDHPALWVEDIPPSQTRDYTKRVVGSMTVYRALYSDRLRVPAE